MRKYINMILYSVETSSTTSNPTTTETTTFKPTTVEGKYLATQFVNALSED